MDWNQRYSYNFPTTIRFGKGVIDELSDHLIQNELKSPLIVTDPTLPSLDFFKGILNSLVKSGIRPSVFNELDKNPIESNVIKGSKEYHATKSDCIIGIGGGASMDVARAIALKANHERDLFDFDDSLGGDKLVINEIPYFITIPTTSGTGSEVGRSAVISEDDTHKKRILFSPRLMPSFVIADPELTLSLPSHICAATGMDALSHNIEAYFSKGFSPLCDGIAIEAIRLISQSLEAATNRPNIENKSKMMMSALMGATSFQKGLGIVHSLAHPLSTLFDTHHGLANAVMLPYGIEFNQDVCSDKLKHLSLVLGLEVNDQSFINWIKELNVSLSTPKDLESIGIKKDGIDRLSHLAFEDVCHQCNPKKVTQLDFKNIYKKAF